MDERCQNTNRVLLVEPHRFRINEETQEDNYFQPRTPVLDVHVAERAKQEFRALCHALESAGVEVVLKQNTLGERAPDAIFPNNWFSTHSDGQLVLYPMRHENRRLERRDDIIEFLSKSYPNVLDLRSYELQEQYLEGTGSLVLDRVNRIAYACVSERSSEALIRHWSEELGYEVELFTAVDSEQRVIYHTNVMMGLGTSFVVICLTSIADKARRREICLRFEKTGKEIVDISHAQVEQFCGNVLELRSVPELSSAGTMKQLLVMSSKAYRAFSVAQRETLSRYVDIVHSDLHTIEECGGGGARCMMAELF